MMKHFMTPRNHISRENHDAASTTSPNPKSKPYTSPNPSNRKFKSTKENSDPNSMASASPAGKMKSPLPPRPPLKRKLSVESAVSETSAASSLDTGVKVIVRVKPPNNNDEAGQSIVEKHTTNSISVSGQCFTFDSVADIQSRQVDIFRLVGEPLVENCLAGFNSSVFAYGQTGSGKTYTIWGGSNTLLEEDQQGLAPRVFSKLFARINEEQVKHADRQLVYMCHCSFLEIYNEQVTDLLDPIQKNLQIREDAKAGVFVENLREECVSSMKDVTQLLMKGLSNRRTSATHANAESSRSHSVFTCLVESRSKNTADGLSSLKMSKINFVDLAGSERQKQTGAAGERLKEAGNINRSLSQLGNLINILAEVSQTGKQRHIPYRDSKLTFLLQESLGGNAKLAMICAVSPNQSCRSETLSTLRFAQRAKAIKNKAVVNEERQDDVNVLRGVIQQLRDELCRMKGNHKQTAQNGVNTTGWSARRSLNLLRFSLSRPMTLPHTEDDSDEEMEIVDIDEGLPTITEEQGDEDTDVKMEDVPFDLDDQDKRNNITLSSCENNPPIIQNSPVDQLPEDTEKTPEKSTYFIADGIPGHVSPVNLKSPTPSVSLRLNSSRKSLRTSSSMTASQSKREPSVIKPSSSILFDSRSNSRSCFASTDQLAATLNRGLEIIQSQHFQRTAPPIKGSSSFRFSCLVADSKTTPPVLKVDAGVQTMFHEGDSSEKDVGEPLCSKCKSRNPEQESVDDCHGHNMQLVPVTKSLSEECCTKKVPKAVEKVLAGAIRREMALEETCAKQNFEIMHLNRLVQQYKHERECNDIINRTRKDKISRLERLMDGVLPASEFMDNELLSITHEHKILQKQFNNHPDVLRTQIELERAHDELERYQNFFDLGERDILLEEVQDLRNQLQFYLDSSAKTTKRQVPLLELPSSCEPQEFSITPNSISSAEEKLHQERIQWTETESKWISLVEELKLELESNRSTIQKQKLEMSKERRCSEELKEAMQLAMEGHARMLEQYAELEEKHMELLARNRQIQDGIENIKKTASKAGVKGAESRFINALAEEISVLKVEREKERKYFMDENKVLQSQLRDTAEAIQAAGELLVRLKEAEEAVTASKKRAIEVEQETQKAYKEVDKLNTLLLAKEEIVNEKNSPGASDYNQQWREEFAPTYDLEEEPSSWFSGYDRCNI